MNTSLKVRHDHSEYISIKKRRYGKTPTLRKHVLSTQDYLQRCDEQARYLGSIRPVETWTRNEYAKEMHDHMADERMLLRAWESLKGEAPGIDGVKLEDVPRYAAYRIWCNECRLFGKQAPPFSETIFPTINDLDLFIMMCVCDPEHRYNLKRMEFDRDPQGKRTSKEHDPSKARSALEQLKQMRSGFFTVLPENDRRAIISEIEKSFPGGTHMATVMMRLLLPGALPGQETENGYRTLLHDTGMGRISMEQITRLFFAGIEGSLDLVHRHQAKSFVINFTPLTLIQKYVKDDNKKPISINLKFRAMRWIGRTLLRPKRDGSIGYHPGPLRKVELPKPDGGKRTLSLPTIMERTISKSAMMVAQPVMEKVFLPCSVGCRYDRDRFDALAAMSDYYPRNPGKIIVTADIKKAFDNVPHDKLLKVLAKYTPNQAMNELYVRTIRRPGFESGRGIAQGDPLSPFFLNVLLHEYLDVPLDSFMKESGLIYFRYVDDLSILGLASREEAGSIITKIQELLRPIGLELHTQAPKTQIIDLTHSGAEYYTSINVADAGQVDRYLGLGLRGRRNGELEFFLPSSWPERIRTMYVNAEEYIRRNGYACTPSAHKHILHATDSWIQAFAPALPTEPREETITHIIAVCYSSAQHTGLVNSGALEDTWRKAQDWWKRKCGEYQEKK